jgi:hypothetical protein
MLASFMGHDLRVHRSFYWLPDDTTQVAHLAKTFLMMENGSITAHRRQALQDIDVRLPTNDDGK